MKAPLLAVTALLMAAPLNAQASRFLTAGLAGGMLSVTDEPASGPAQTFSGMVLGGGGTLTFKMVGIEVLYSQGKLTSDSGAALSRDLVDGYAMLVVRPTAWLSLKTGPHLRSYVTTASTAQFQAWEARVRLEGMLVEGRVRAQVEGFRSLSATVNFGAEVDYVQGGMAGVVFQLPRSPIWGRLSYLIDQVAGTDGSRQTLDGLILSLGFGGR